MKSIEMKYAESARVDGGQIAEVKRLADEYTSHLREVVVTGGYDSLEASLNLCDDAPLQQLVDDLAAQKKTDSLKYIFVIGIGGSNLGTYAVYNALRGAYSELLPRTPKIIFVDTVSTSLMQTVLDIIEKDIHSADEVCVNVTSKSGNTAETIALFEIIYRALKEKFDTAHERIVVTTDEGSGLHKSSIANGFPVLFLPAKVGGRYSVFSAVGLFPLALAGIDTKSLLEGARLMRDRCLQGDGDASNVALTSAALTYHYYTQGIRINNSFFFNPELEMVGKWYRQLMGESVGKEYGISGEKVHAGITPIVSIGSTDLHSMAQLYFGGPRDKFTCFVRAAANQDMRVPSERIFPELVLPISGKSLEEIMQAIYGGVKAAYQNNELPYVEILLPEITAGTIGQYLQLKMMEMMYLAQLMEVNAFDQPNVEDYKEETRKLL